MRIEERSAPELEAEKIQALHRVLDMGAPKFTGPDGEELALPESVYGMLREIVRNMEMGYSITIVPERELLTTQTVATLLGCSRPHVVKLLETGAMPFEMAGTHRRVRYSDLLVFKAKRDTERHAALSELAREAVREGYYVGVPLEDGQSDE